MLLELSKRYLILPKYEEPTLTWHNFISVRSLKQITCFEFARDLYSFEKKINVIESDITCNNSSPVSSSLLKSYVKRGIKNIELTEMIMDPSLWPYSNLIMQEMVQLVSFEWSPSNIIFNNQKLLATVNSCGNVDLYYAKENSLFFATNMSETLKNHLRPDKIVVPSELNDMRNIVYNLATSAICWAPLLEQDKSCCFVTAQKSGEITLWKIKCENDKVQTEFIGSFQGLKTDIESIVWLNIKNNSYLICANTLGQVFAYEYKLSITIKLIRQISIWDHNDKMIAKHLHHVTHKDKLLFIYTKNRHLIMQLFDKNLELLSQYTKIVNDYKITCMAKAGDDFYIGTINAKIFKVSYVINNNDNISVTIDNIPYKDISPTHELYGIGVSDNKTLFAVLLIDRQVYCRKESTKMEIAFLKLENSYEYDVDRLINNPTKQLTNLWDHLEVIRYKIFKTKKFPEVDYENLYLEGSLDVYKMKVYLVFLILYINIKSSKTVTVTNKLPELSVEKVKENILILHAVNMLDGIFNKHNMGKLSSFKLECFNGARQFVYYYCRKYQRDVTEFVSEDICNWSEVNMKYICQSCDDEIEGFSCKSGHFNPFCFLTFTPIESEDYFVCKSCKIIARSELHELEPKCVFCDSYLNFSKA